MDKYNVVWTSPSKDSSGSMPLGNGDIGLNVWVEESGDMLFYISKTDSWDEKVQLPKLGRVRVSLSPNPLAESGSFRQTLRLRQGDIEVRFESGTVIRVWVDANQPVIHVEAESTNEFSLTAFLELWREREHVLPLGENGVIWYDRNETSIWAANLKLQGHEERTRKDRDPLLGRTFGGIIKGDNLTRRDERTLVSAKPSRHQMVSIYANTAVTDTPEEWIDQIKALTRRVDEKPLEEARREHLAWWDEFWNRSWIRVSPESQGLVPVEEINTHALQLRLGATLRGGRPFRGEIDNVKIYDRALSGEEIAGISWFEIDPSSVACWTFDNEVGGAFESPVGKKLTAKVVGAGVEIVDGRYGKCARFDGSGKGWIEIQHDQTLSLKRACTLSAWVRPDSQPGSVAKIIDKCPHEKNGYALELRDGAPTLQVTAGTFTAGKPLPQGEWTHIAATFDVEKPEQKVYVNGKLAGSRRFSPQKVDVSERYVLQRFVNACGGRGAFPIKFNGSIFTVDSRELGENASADYRRWGGLYWFQNTRLPYWPMLASGDFDLMQPLFQMYDDILPVAKERTRIWFGHDGAFFPETFHWWGTLSNGSYGANREGRKISDVAEPSMRYHYEGNLELLALMIDYYNYTSDEGFLKEMLLPMADELITFFDKHYQRDANGKLYFYPGQALETYKDAENPVTEIAGLHWVLQELLRLPDQALGERKVRWERLISELPPIPTSKENGKKRILPAEKPRSVATNVENPELYPIFPFRLYGVGKPDIETARNTWEARLNKSNMGWQQDDIQAAHLGLTEEAKKLVQTRFAAKHLGSRFPAFYGPNFDWIPDQDHSNNGVNALQSMLLQSDGDRILLFPAWPKEWNVEFKLHAPKKTVVEGVYKNGKLERLKVTPEKRMKDVELVGLPRTSS